MQIPKGPCNTVKHTVYSNSPKRSGERKKGRIFEEKWPRLSQIWWKRFICVLRWLSLKESLPHDFHHNQIARGQRQRESPTAGEKNCFMDNTHRTGEQTISNWNDAGQMAMGWNWALTDKQQSTNNSLSSTTLSWQWSRNQDIPRQLKLTGFVASTYAFQEPQTKVLATEIKATRR